MLLLDQELARRLERDGMHGNSLIAEVWPRVNPSSTLDVLRVEGSIALYGGAVFPINEAVGLGMDAAVEDSVLDQIEAFYHQRGSDAVIRLCPLAHESLLHKMGRRGYRIAEYAYRWVIDLTEWRSPFAEPDPRVRAVDLGDSHDVQVWCETVSDGFCNVDGVGAGGAVDGVDGVEAPDAPDAVRAATDLGLERAFCAIPGAMPVLCTVGDEPACAGMLATGAGIASLFATSTRPRFRQRGLQTALLDWRLRKAQELGMEIATIETDPASGSARNAQRMGFALAYVATSMHLPPKP